MACFVPFNNRNLEISFFIFRPIVAVVDELVETLKHFSACTESLGCVQSSIFKSIHGNMIIWYGAWMKKSCENKELLTGELIIWYGAWMKKSCENKELLTGELAKIQANVEGWEVV
ncbi:hypothetical protein NC652_028688 [Populus alba x Populus x berolinensis]|nr:hypothetical protein NC652_028688 [Populus alba x Populus x berolinensis]